MGIKIGVISVLSKNNIQIRLTEERWKHIVLMHPNIAKKQKKVLNTVKNPEGILKENYWQFPGFLEEATLW